MSFQLVYTSAAELLEPGTSGYGVVACSVAMPKLLCDRLVSLSELKEPVDCGIIGPQYSYRLVSMGAHIFHVFTCTGPAGADYTGRACYLAHHFVLSAEEAAAMASNPLHPTPAGLVLALRKIGYWAERWEGRPQYLETEPGLTPAAFPSAEGQPAWVACSGNAACARLLAAPPYDAECLLTLPQETRAETALELLHESDSLAPQRGWGRTFTTYGCRTDSFRVTSRMVAAAGSDLEQAVTRMGGRVLRVVRGMSAESGAAPHRQHGHYRYEESAEEDVFCRPVRRRGMSAVWVVSAALLGLGGAWIYSSRRADMPPVTPPQPIAPLDPVQQALDDLRALMFSPFASEPAEKALAGVEQRLVACPASRRRQVAPVLEVVTILKLATVARSGHADNLRRLDVCGRRLNLDEDALCRLYLHVATAHCRVEDWLNTMGQDAEMKSWQSLLDELPMLRQNLLEVPELMPYMAPLAGDRPIEPLPVAVQEEPRPVEPSRPVSPPALTAPTREVTVLSTRALPPELLNVFARVPVELPPGELRLFSARALQSPKVKPLITESGERLRLVHSEEAGDYVLERVSSTDAGEAREPLLVFTVQGAYLKSVRDARGRSVLSSFLIPIPEGGVARLLVADAVRIPLELGSTSLPAAVQRFQFNFSESDLEASPATGTRPARLGMRDDAFPWVPFRQELRLRPQSGVVYLPALHGKGALVPEAAPRLPYSWGAQLGTPRGGEVGYVCSVSREFDFSAVLSKQFNLLANSCCCGEEPHGDARYSLAGVWCLLQELEQKNLGRGERQRLTSEYCKLFRNVRFAELMGKILVRCPELTLHHRDAAGNSFSAREAREKLSAALALPANRRRIRAELCGVLQRGLQQTFNRLVQDSMRQPAPRHLVLVLTGLEVDAEGELRWYFTLQEK
ncbi:MAG: hypothetical protein MR894_00290 [Akkermansia muciniphila]|nr:hypothetical protein [Akkermansia muciniphila]